MDLVTGAAGLLGYNLVLKLQSIGRRVRAFDYQRPASLPDGVEIVAGDVRDRAAMECALDGIDTVFHLAAIMHVGKFKPVVVESVNIGGLRNLLECAAASRVRRIVFASSIEIYGVEPSYPCYEDSPKSPPAGYPEHKWRGEKMCLEFSEKHGIEVVFTRMPMIFGPGFYHFKPLLLMFDAIRLGLPMFVLDGGGNKGVVVGLRDAVNGIILASAKPEAAGEAFNICGPDVFTHLSFISVLIRMAGSVSPVFSVPSAIVRPGFEIVRALGLSPVAPEHFYFTLSDCVYDISKARKMLGYDPKTESVQAAFEAYQSYIAARRAPLKRKVASEILSFN